MFFNPPQVFDGNMIEHNPDSGFHVLSPKDIRVRKVASSCPDQAGVEVYWQEAERRRKRKRLRASGTAVLSKVRKEPGESIQLVAVNKSATLEGSISVSLPHTMDPRRLNGTQFELTELRRLLPRDITPNIPLACGNIVRFCTVHTRLAPRSVVQLLQCPADSDDKKQAGFVFLAGVGGSHPSPMCWEGYVLHCPLGPRGDGVSTWECTQGFGGNGHHHGPDCHHAADFQCSEGTPVLAVFNGRVIKVQDSRHLGGPHVDLLPEANIICVQRHNSSAVAMYLHLEPRSSVVMEGQDVLSGQVLGRAGRTGFSTGQFVCRQLSCAARILCSVPSRCALAFSIEFSRPPRLADAHVGAVRREAWRCSPRCRTLVQRSRLA
jgi:murein DD-endopeptidase MepM/ murein hydrolase activator NlpD